MNVIGSRPTGWWRDREGAVRSLVERLQRYAEQTGDEVTVVVDSAAPAEVSARRHGRVRILYARRQGRDAADDRIVELIEADASPETLEVVTSDRDLVRRAGALGAAVRSAGSFLRALDSVDRASSA